MRVPDETECKVVHELRLADQLLLRERLLLLVQLYVIHDPAIFFSFFLFPFWRQCFMLQDVPEILYKSKHTTEVHQEE